MRARWQQAPGLLIDPVEGFFAGLGAGLWRYLWGFAAIPAGAVVCLLPVGSDAGHGFFYVVGPLSIVMVFYWATLSLWWFVGLLALIGMLTAVWTFAQDIHPRRAWFVAFSLACLYYLPIVWQWEYRWGWAVGLYSLTAAAYWLLPVGWNRWRAALEERAEREKANETAGEGGSNRFQKD